MKIYVTLFLLTFFMISLVSSCNPNQNDSENELITSKINPSIYEYLVPAELFHGHLIDSLNTQNITINRRVESSIQTNIGCGINPFLRFVLKETAYQTINLPSGPMTIPSGCYIRTYGCDGNPNDNIKLLKEEYIPGPAACQ